MPRIRPHQFVLPATVERIVDADTLRVLATVLPWPKTTVALTVRLYGVNGRERDEPGGPEASAALAALLPAGTPVTLTLVREDEWGRTVAVVVRQPDGLDIGDRMVGDGWAAWWTGRGEKVVPAWPNPLAPAPVEAPPAAAA